MGIEMEEDCDYETTDMSRRALAECDRDFYPAIYSYLKLYCCLPTTASSKRTFSTLKYLKNCFAIDNI